MFERLSDILNENGLEMRVVLKPEYELWWNKQSVKTHLFKPLMHVMYDKWHTADLTTKEIDKVFEMLQKMLGEKFGLEIVWPSIEETEEYINSFKE